jgi:hypothetical protein
MFTIDIILKYTPSSLSVQRKSVEDADAVYQQVLTALGNGSQVLQLTCEKQPEKKIAVLSSEILAVQVSQKSGTAAAGRAPGFVSFAE